MWSAGPSPAFTRRLVQPGFSVEGGDGAGQGRRRGAAPHRLDRLPGHVTFGRLGPRRRG
ncbi:MAG: hypothetical protein MZV64_31850 [Ignavibacteriales bacterium]|nr:hypothetical protein [Ignavibacteriales bacterium]